MCAWRRVFPEFLSRTSCRELRIEARTRRSHCADGDFDVAVKVYIDADRPASLKVTAKGNWSADATTTTVAVAPGETALALSLQRASGVALWRPNGLGARAFYEVSVAANNVITKRRVAFRTVAVVTGDDTDPDYIKQSENASGTASHGLFLRVNGAALWARGANVVPTEILEGRDTAERQQRLVASAAAAGFNTIRVWGGGAFLARGLLRRVRRARSPRLPRPHVRAERPRAPRHGH